MKNLPHENFLANRPKPGTKHGICRHCGDEKDYEKGRGFTCKDCNNRLSREWAAENKQVRNQSAREWSSKNRDKLRTYKKEYQSKLQDAVFGHYGESCQCCGESIRLLLTVDHVENDGKEHREAIGGKNIYLWLVEEDFPEGFQVLCYSCNIGKYKNGGVCPHVDGENH